MNYRSWIDHIFPTCCLLCGASAAKTLNLCDGCRQDLPIISSASCLQCARPTPQPTVCGHCLQHRPAFSFTLAALRYEGYGASLVQRFKFAGDQVAGKILGFTLAQRAAHAERPDVLIPIPLSPQRLRARGFDQSWELTRYIAKMLALSTDFASVRRISHHVPQSSLKTWSARQRNVRRVFHVEPTRITGKRVVLVDDVMTSGATANSLALALRHAGATRVDVWVPCRAGLSFDVGGFRGIRD